MVINGLLMYVGLLVLLTFHEFGHAWMALQCGDDTAKLQGRVSLNPIVHIDFVGTVILPLAMIFLSMAGSGLASFLVGWAKPVPVNPHNLKNPKMDDILVSMAGPWMNLALAVVLMALARAGVMAGLPSLVELGMTTAYLSLMLCFFNLIPVPPLDGSHVLRNVIGMSYETYYSIARYGFIIVIVLLQIPFVRALLSGVTRGSWNILAGWFGLAG
jgi:Zn-dependent protease